MDEALRSLRHVWSGEVEMHILCTSDAAKVDQFSPKAIYPTPLCDQSRLMYGSPSTCPGITKNLRLRIITQSYKWKCAVRVHSG
jgi:hypothetical protein